MDVRRTFLNVATTARNLIARPSVGESWGEESALRHMTIGAVAAHLGRAVLTVDRYLRTPASGDGDLVDGVGYFLTFADDMGHDVDTELNQAVRTRADEAAADGHDGLLRALDAALGRLADDLETAPPDFTVEVLGGLRIRLDDYLVTRLVELTVHIDDLAASIADEPPPIDERAMRIAIACLVDVARRGHGDMAVLRALSRRERDPGGVIPVL